MTSFFTLIKNTITRPTREGSGWIIEILVGASMMSFALQTMDSPQGLKDFLWGLDVVVLLVYLVEYAARVYLSSDKMRTIIGPLAIIDLLVIVSFAELFWDSDWAAALSIGRILQVLKLLRYSPLIQSFLNAFKNYKDEFQLFVASFLLVMVIGGFGIFRLEHVMNPQFSTLGNSLWWSIVTMSTVGYGDIVPITKGGKILSAFIMIAGLATMALLTAMVTKIFIDHFFGKRQHKCLQCRYPDHDFDAAFCKNCGSQLIDLPPEEIQ